MKKRELLFILLSIALATITRFYKLGEVPSGLYLDEAAQGYNAFSILKTGKDEFGKSFPIVFRSFTDFKTPVYIYTIVPLIPIFGLTKFAVRFPSFFASILTIPIFFLLIKKISPKKVSQNLASISILLLAVSPWHILFGRTNFECNLALFLYLTGLYFFYVSLEKPKALILSAIFFAIAIPAYHSQRIVTPLTLLYLFAKNNKTLFSKSHKKIFLISLAIGFILLFPTLKVALTPGFLARASGLNIFTRVPAGYSDNQKNLAGFFINNKMLLLTKQFLALYISYFSPRNMFILGDYGKRSSFPELSTFFIWQFPFYIIGLYLLIKSKKLGEIKNLTLLLLIISPLPAAVTHDPYSTIRALPLVIPQIIVISLGINWLYSKLLFNKFSKLVFLAGSAVLLTYSLLKLQSSVIILNEYYRATDWNYGWEEVANTIKNDLDKNLPIIVDNTRSEPHSQLLFFLEYTPKNYQKDNSLNLQEYYTNMKRNKNKIIGNITTRPINWEEDLKKEMYLIGDELAISTQQIQNHNLTLIREIKYPDQSPAFRIVKTNLKSATSAF